MATIAVINFTWQAHFKEISYQINNNYSVLDFLGGSFWIFRAVLFEELLFRGVLLYLLIKHVGMVKARVFSSIVFGIYHWFSYEVFGSRLVLMIYVILITGAGGWMFAYAFAKTKSLYAPIGHQWLIQQGDTIQTNGWVTLLFFSLQTIIAPGLVTWYLHSCYTSANSHIHKNAT